MIEKKLLLKLMCFSAALFCVCGVAQHQKSGHGWGLNFQNHRFQSNDKSFLNSTNVDRLKLKWVYALGTQEPRSYPLVLDDRLFIGDGNALTALDLESGKQLWSFDTESPVSTAISHAYIDGEDRLFFSARGNGVYSISADGTKEIWFSPAGRKSTATYSGSPLVVGDQIFVPVASSEIGLAMIPFYGCCKDSGALVALDIRTGETNWHLNTITEPAKKVGYGFLLIRRFAPSGAPVWGAPTYDSKRKLVYFGTGQNYSLPASDTSDAIFAVEESTGEIRWVTQFTEDDAYNLACNLSPSHWNCPDPPGPDVDFGAPPILYETRDGNEILLAGQKSGDLHAIDPDDGSVLWTKKLGRGGLLGGVHHGMALNPIRNLIYVPIFDIYTDPKTGALPPNGGLHAVDIVTGEVAWSATYDTGCEERNCWPGISVSPIANESIVVVGTINGDLLIYDAVTGDLLWSYYTRKSFPTVEENVHANGGSFDVHGALLYEDKLIVTSGYGNFGQIGGNALLVFAIDDE